MNVILLYIVIVVATASLIISGVALFILWRQRNYLERIMNYGSGLADIQATIKAAIMEHHDIEQEAIDAAKLEILRHITFTNRWQKVIAKLIKIKGATPLEKATGSETLEEAAELHEVGLDIAKVAFEDKQELDAEIAADNNNKQPT